MPLRPSKRQSALCCYESCLNDGYCAFRGCCQEIPTHRRLMHLTWYNLFLLYTHSQVGQGWSSLWLDDTVHTLEREKPCVLLKSALPSSAHVNCNCFFAPLCHLHLRGLKAGLVNLSHVF